MVSPGKRTLQVLTYPHDDTFEFYINGNNPKLIKTTELYIAVIYTSASNVAAGLQHTKARQIAISLGPSAL